MNPFVSGDVSVDEEVSIEEIIDLVDQLDLIVYNDDYNTFDHVIDTLITVCGHDVVQAEQCTHLIHFKGKCAVKKGTFEELKPMRMGIEDAGIKANIV